jgi:hypothetical protein
MSIGIERMEIGYKVLQTLKKKYNPETLNKIFWAHAYEKNHRFEILFRLNIPKCNFDYSIHIEEVLLYIFIDTSIPLTMERNWDNELFGMLKLLEQILHSSYESNVIPKNIINQNAEKRLLEWTEKYNWYGDFTQTHANTYIMPFLLNGYLVHYAPWQVLIGPNKKTIPAYYFSKKFISGRPKANLPKLVLYKLADVQKNQELLATELVALIKLKLT